MDYETDKIDWNSLPFFAEELESTRLQQGVPLFSPDQQIEKFYVLQSGLLGLYRFVEPNKRVLLQKITSGETVGVTQLLLDRPYPAHLIPIKESVARTGTSNDISVLKDNDKDTLIEILRQESESHAEVYQKVEEYLSGSVDTRIARELLELSEKIGRQTKDGSEIVIKLSRKDVSRLVGCSHETASRIMSEWEQDGTIQTDQKMITIANPQSLRSSL